YSRLVNKYLKRRLLIMTKQTIFRKYRIERVLESSSLYDLTSNVVRSPECAVDIFKKVFNTDSMTKEHFMLLTLDTKNKVMGSYTVHVGSLNVSIVHPRDVFQAAILDNAAGIIVGHNHPSGDPAP